MTVCPVRTPPLLFFHAADMLVDVAPLLELGKRNVLRPIDLAEALLRVRVSRESRNADQCGTDLGAAGAVEALGHVPLC